MGGDPLGVRIIKPKPMKCLKDHTWAFERECGIELGGPRGPGAAPVFHDKRKGHPILAIALVCWAISLP
jgi:hypothetical protein